MAAFSSRTQCVKVPVMAMYPLHLTPDITQCNAFTIFDWIVIWQTRILMMLDAIQLRVCGYYRDYYQIIYPWMICQINGGPHFFRLLF